MNFVETILADYPVMAWAAVGVTFLMVAVAWAGFVPEPLLLKLVVFAAVGVALIVPLRALLRRFSDRTPDINTY